MALFLESIKLEVCGRIFSLRSGCEEKGRLSHDAAALLQGGFLPQQCYFVASF